MSRFIDNTGRPSSDNLLLGRGAVFVSDLASSGRPLGFRHLGNCPGVQIELNSESLEHFDTRQQVRTLDTEIILEVGARVSITLDEFTAQNVALWSLGSVHDAPYTNPAGGGVACRIYADASNPIEAGRWYDIYDPTLSSGDADGRVYDIENGQVTSVTNSGGGTTYTATTDYLIDQTMGRLFVPFGSAMVGQTAAPVVNLAAPSGTVYDIQEVRGLVQTSRSVAIKVISRNGNSQRQVELNLWSVKLKPTGTVELINPDNFAELTVEGALEQNAGYSPDSPFFTMRSHEGAIGA